MVTRFYSRWIENYQSLGEALERFHEIIEEPEDKNSYVRDATIRRFKFCIELSWKLFKKVGEEEGMEIPTPKAALKAAFTMKFIQDELIWLNMMEDRNITSHTYRESLAKEVYLRVKNYYDAMKEAYDRVGKRYTVTP
jgi:nucleotidyltransferase substrate binding protein (TIGR01987 family)